MPSWVNFLVYIVCGYLSLAQVRHEFQSLFRMKQEQASRTGSLPMVNNDNANTRLAKFSVIGSDIDDVALQQNYGVPIFSTLFTNPPPDPDWEDGSICICRRGMVCPFL